VTTPLDEFDGGTAANPAGADGQMSLREAISAANSGDQVTFDQSLSGSTIALDPNQGELFINKTLDIVGLGAANLAVSGQNSNRVFEIAAGVTDSISGLTIENGKAGSSFAVNGAFEGGGILNEGTLTVSGCILSGSSADRGGGIYNGYPGNLAVVDSSLIGNSGRGGGIADIEGTVTVSDSNLSSNNGSGIDMDGNQLVGAVTVTGSTLSGNNAGGIDINGGTLTVTGCTLSNNGSSGGINNYYGTVTVTNSTLSGNSTGGIANLGGTLTVNGSTLSNNSSSQGGGIWNDYGTAWVSGCTLSGNSASDGGGIYNFNAGQLTVTDSTLIGNSAFGHGGAIYSSEAKLTVNNCTLSQNSASNDGGGIHIIFGTTTVSGSTLTGNSSGDGGGIYSAEGTHNGTTYVLNVSGSTLTGNSGTSEGGGIDNAGEGTAGVGTSNIMNSTVCGNSAPIGADLANHTPGTVTVTNSDLCAIAQATVVAATSSSQPSLFGQAVTFTATVLSPDGGTPNGTVTFFDENSSTTLGTVTLDSSGRATFTTSTLSADFHFIVVFYNGAANFTDSIGGFEQDVLTAQQVVGPIADQVNSLVSGASLSSGNGTALTTKLNSGIASLNGGKTTAGINQLNAFINQVTAFQKNGKLTSDQAQALISAANLAITAASGGSGAHLTNQDASAASGSADTQPVSDAGQLVTGTIGFYLDNADGTPVAADEQARFDDAIAALDATFGSYGVNLVDVGATDAADAIVQVEIADTSAAGSAADGVLGCTVAGHITLLTGWNWYTGADPSAIGAGQYDFETIVTHELGHAIGLGHSGDTSSVMYPYLASGVVSRTVTTQDMSVLEAATGTTPEPLLAAPPNPAAAHVVPSNGVGQAVVSGIGAGIGQRMPTSDLARNLFFALLSASPDALPLGSRQLSVTSAEPGRTENLAGRDAFFGTLGADRLPSQNVDVSGTPSSSPIFAGALTDQDEDAPVFLDASQPDDSATVIGPGGQKTPYAWSADVNDAP
jgi:predicted outer membrane repeat protein